MNTITKPQEWLLSAFLFALTLLFVGLLVLNLDFQAWAFERHQNQLSWYIVSFNPSHLVFCLS